MTAYEHSQAELRDDPKTWLVTGVAGFIGSNLLETLLRLDQRVVGLDNLATGSKANFAKTKAMVTEKQWSRFSFIEGDIRDAAACERSCHKVDYVLHQAALGSVPRSIAVPIDTHDTNVTGFLNMLVAARDHGVKRFVYASSSAVYGDHPDLPKVEEKVGRCLSPYAATKSMNELYAEIFGRCYELNSIGLRYFNVFGPRQDPDGPYAAVIPKWVGSMLRRETVFINGDGTTSRDFCYVANVVQANILAALTANKDALGQVFNVAASAVTTLNELFELLRSCLRKEDDALESFKPDYRAFRAGDILHSHADISKARKLLAYEPTHSIQQGIAEALAWYVADFRGGTK